MKEQRVNRLSGLCILMSVCLLLMTSTGCSAPDHFKVYDVDSLETQHFRVGLTDQFSLQQKDARITTLTHFANPVAKTPVAAPLANIQNKHAHLTWYRLQQQQPEPRRTVRFENQFGQHSVDIRQPRYLLVPAEKKSDPASKFPKGLDHYKCYDVIKVSTFPGTPLVRLEDQFGVQNNVQVDEPVLFCLPVMKERPGEQPQRIKNKRNHLAVYPITPEGSDKQISVQDQFRERDLVTRNGVFLCVPTTKQDVVTHND